MLSFLTLFIIVWFMIFTAARFFQYFRIVTEYKDVTTAVVEKVTEHVPSGKREKKALDVILTYMIDGEEKRSEITVPGNAADKYTVGKEFEICYRVSDNGTVHIASYSSAKKKIIYGHIAALILELAAFIILWYSML